MPESDKQFVVAAASVAQDRSLGLSEPEYCPQHWLLQVCSYSRVACHHIELSMTAYGENLVRSVESTKGIGALVGSELLNPTSDPWALPEKGY